MRFIFIIFIAVYGLILLAWFSYSFYLLPVPFHPDSMSPLAGIVCLGAFIFFSTTIILLLKRSTQWWPTALAGVVLSQIVIITHWGDLGLFTLANMVIFVPAGLAWSTAIYSRKVKREVVRIYDERVSSESAVVTEEMLDRLPPPVRKWLKVCKVIGKEMVRTVYLTQDLKMQLKPGQENWVNAKANQYFTTEPPAFVWSVNLKMNSLFYMTGRDKFENGEGEMRIKFFSLFTLVLAGKNEKVHQAAMQRFLSEMVWFPSAVLLPYISWEAIDEHSAKATMEYMGTEGSGIFHFDQSGHFEKFVAMRYKDVHDSEPTEWTVRATGTEERNGIKIPVACEVDWKLKEGTHTWLKLILTGVSYDAEDFILGRR